MKKHLSLIAALCALLAGCAKETPGPKDEPQAEMITVTIGASVQENTKTSIGEKDGDKYPVLWSEGDRIAVNGNCSAEADIEDEGRTAYFEVSVPVAEKYTLVYPFNENASANEVIFSGLSLPMWAETTDLEEGVEFKALYGVLKLSVTGEATITRILLSTQDGAQVTGKFEIGAEGVLTGKEETATTLEYVCPEAVSTPADFYIPVPAGTYNIIDVQLFDSEGTSMTKKIGGGNNYTVGAGKVKEFPAFAYTVNQHMFAIASTADLEKFAALVTAGTFSAKYESAVVAKDIEAPADWSSLDYTGVFDGGNKTISALKAPLFGTLTDAEVKNVVIAANMTNTSELNYGALAKQTTGNTTVDNCKVSGTVLLNLTGNATTNKFNFAGLVGLVGGGSISNSQSTANVQLNHPGTGAKEIHIGGIAGEVATGVTIDNCTINDQLIKTNDSNGNTSVNIYIGGIAGLLNNGATIQNCVIPKKSANSNVSLSLRMDANNYRAGGIVGQCLGTVKNCTNGQGVSASKGSQKVNYAYFGGIAGSAADATISGCTNTGTIYWGNASGTTVAQTVQTRMGGIVGTIGNTTITSCTNGGAVEYSGNASSTTWFAVGGIAGYCDKIVIDGWVNSGKITIRPTANAKGASAGFQVGVGGLVGLIPATTGSDPNKVSGSLSFGSNPSNNSGSIVVEKALAPTSTTSNNFAYVGGIVGAFRGGAATTYTVKNTGDIIIGTPVTQEDKSVVYTALPNVAAGAIIGHTAAGASSKATFDGCEVKCKIVNQKATYTGPAILCGWSGNNKVYKNCKVGGTVNYLAEGSQDVVITASNYKTYLFVGGSATDGGNNAIWE